MTLGDDESIMRFDIIRDSKKVKRIQSQLQATYRSSVSERGTLVSYSMPALPDLFPQLRAALLQYSKHREGFWGIYYYMETKDQRVRKLIPASEYYKTVFRSLSDKRYSLELIRERIRALLNDIARLHAQSRRIRPRTAQPAFSVAQQVYMLKGELAAFLLFARSMLDTVATLFHFLYGPSSNQFVSFADFARYMSKGHGKGQDVAMENFIRSEMSWFFTLRDFRDWVAHLGTVDVAFYEDSEATLATYTEHCQPLQDLVEPVLEGLDAFFKFVDDHFTDRIEQSSGKTKQ